MPPPKIYSRAFTLVELLVSMAVLVLLVGVVAGIVSAVSRTSTSSQRRLNADNEARRVLDRMGSDFAQMMKRADADSLFASINGANGGGNDKFFFYSDAPAVFDAALQSPTPTVILQSTAGLIGYRINDDTTSTTNLDCWQLERLGKGLSWDGAAPSPAPVPGVSPGPSPGGVVFLTYPIAAAPAPLPTPTPAPYPSPTPYPSSTLAGNFSWIIGTAPNYDDGADSDYQVLSQSVFRLEYAFVLKTQDPITGSFFSRTHDQTKSFSDVSAIVVAIALLDPRDRAQLPGAVAGQSPNMGPLISALPDPDFTTTPGKYTLMADLWNTAIENGSFATNANKLPKSVASQVRVYQRYFYLNTPN
jgi:prepilin-type N-terminal cleavage/methylation domain-containing protein